MEVDENVSTHTYVEKEAVAEPDILFEIGSNETAFTLSSYNQKWKEIFRFLIRKACLCDG